MIYQNSEQKASEKSERTLQKSSSFLTRTSNQIIIIKDQNRLIQALKQLKKKRNQQTKYAKFQGCSLQSISSFLQGAKKYLSNQEESIFRIVCSQCKFHEENQNLQTQPTKISQKQKSLKSFPKFLSTSNSLSALTNISFSKCSLLEFPNMTSFVSDLESLKTLDLSANQLKALPQTALKFLESTSINFKVLVVERNPLEWINIAILEYFPQKIEFQMIEAVESLQMRTSDENISILQICGNILSKQDFSADKLFRKLILEECTHYCKQLLLIIKEYYTPQQILVFAQNYLPFIHLHRKYQIFSIFFNTFPQFLLQELPNFPLYKMILLRTTNLNSPITLVTLSQFINAIGQQFESTEIRKQAFLDFIKSRNYLEQLNSLIPDEKQFEELTDSLEHTGALLLMLKEGVFKFLETSQFTNRKINTFLLSFNDWALIQALYRNSSSAFISKIMHTNQWKSIIKPNSQCYRMLRKTQRKHIKHCVNIVDTNTLENLREYVIPKQYLLRNDIHDYSILKQYEQFHSSFSNKDYSQVFKYRNKENKFSIAKKIEEQIRKKQKLQKTSETKEQTQIPPIKKIVLKRANMKDITNFVQVNSSESTKNITEENKEDSKQMIHYTKRVSITLQGTGNKKTERKGLEILSCRNTKNQSLLSDSKIIFKNARSSVPNLTTTHKKWLFGTLSMSQFD